MPGPLWILSWDGAAPWLLDRAMAEGATPNLARLRAAGARAAGSLSDFPDCTTPPGHAVLWTGHSAHANGVTSFTVPRLPPEKHTLLETGTGFDARLLRREPIWVTACRAGHTATLVHAPVSSPMDPWTPEGPFQFDPGDRLKIFHGYGRQVVGQWVVRDPELRAASNWRRLPFSSQGAREFTVRGKPPRLAALVLPDADGRFDRLWVCRDRTRADLGVLVEAGPDAGWSAPLAFEDGTTVRLRLFEMAPDASRLLLFGTAAHEVEALPRPLRYDYMKALGSFPGSGAYRPYGSGALGERYTDGGAEARYMETNRLLSAHFRDSSRWAATEHPADLMIFYHPGIDELGHMWAGHVEEGERWADPAKAAQVWPHYLQAYRDADEHLGVLMDLLPEDGTLMLVSDHGIGGIQKHFLPNVVLREAGLLFTAGRNRHQIDLSRTRALYHPANNGYVYVNAAPWSSGWVPEAERTEVLEAARDALTRFQDPETGKPVLSAAIPVHGPGADPQLGGPGRGDLFLAIKRGYSLGHSLNRSAILPADLAGHHQQSPGLRHHHAIFEIQGPGVEAGRELGVVSHRDVHETMRHLLDLPPGDGGGEALTRLFTESDG